MFVRVSLLAEFDALSDCVKTADAVVKVVKEWGWALGGKDGKRNNGKTVKGGKTDENIRGNF